MHHTNLSPAEVSRYSRQLAIPGWGRESQERLKSSKVLIAGAGALASSVALHLLAAGVGAIRLVDPTRVGLSDLHHQVLYREKDLGEAKATIAMRRLKEINPFAEVEGQDKSISGHNVSRLTSGCHLLIDAMNNLTVTHLLNQAAVKLRLPLIHAVVWETEGYLTTFWPGQGPCLACAFPDTNASAPGPVALLGPLPGLVGSLQAMEAMRLLGGHGPGLLGKLLRIKGDLFRFSESPVRVNPQCLVCRRLNQ